MDILLLFPLLLVPVALAGDTSSCTGVGAIQRVSSSASGRWYLMAVKKREMMNQQNTQSRQAECSGFSSETPCSCIIYDFNSTIPEPFISEYNITGYLYNMMSEKYEVQYLYMKLVDNMSTKAIFEVRSSGAGNMNMNKMTVIGLATDDHTSFMLLRICMGEDPDAEADVWFLSRSPFLSDNNVQELNRALERNNMNIDDMKRVMQTECVYPPPEAHRNRNEKFRVF